MPDTRKLYSLTYLKGQTGPTERMVALPGGAMKPFSMFQEDENADDFPYAELILTDEQAAEQAPEFAMHGLELKHIKAPKRDKGDSPMHSPQPTTKASRKKE